MLCYAHEDDLSVIKCCVLQGKHIVEMKSVLRFFSSKVLLYIDHIILEVDFIMIFSYSPFSSSQFLTENYSFVHNRHLLQFLMSLQKRFRDLTVDMRAPCLQPLPKPVCSIQ